MTRRRDLLSLVALGAAGASRAQGKQPPVGKRRLAVLWHERQVTQDDELAQAMRTALAAFGWVAGQNLAIEWHFGNGDANRLHDLAAEIVRSNPDAILTFFVPPTKALQLATKKIPIVTSVGDPVGFGFTRSYARPDGNITGLSLGYVESQRKSIELLRDAVPATTRLILAVHASRSSDAEALTRAAMGAARELGFVPEIVLVLTAADLRAALRSARPSALVPYGFSETSLPLKTGEVIALALGNNVPTVGGNSESVELGALLSYTLYWDNQVQRLAAQLDQVLRGVSPALIPFELPARSWVAVNLKSALALGLVLPRAVLTRADEVIK